MPFADVSELPYYVAKALTTYDQEQWLKAYNSTFMDTGDPYLSYKSAWNYIKDSPDLRLVGGWATVDSVDKQGEVVSIKDMRESMDEFIKAGGAVYDRHSNRNVGVCFDWENGVHPETKTEAIKVKTACFRGERIYDKTWERIKTGQFKDFSVAGDALRQVRKCSQGKCYNHLEKMHFYDLSYVPVGANNFSHIDQVNHVAKCGCSEEKVDSGRFLNKLSAYYKMTGMNATGRELVEKCGVCAEVHKVLAQHMTSEEADQVVKAMTDKISTMEPQTVAKAEDGVQESLNKVLAMVSQQGNEIKALKQSILTIQAGGMGQSVPSTDVPEVDDKASPGEPENMDSSKKEEGIPQAAGEDNKEGAPAPEMAESPAAPEEKPDNEAPAPEQKKDEKEDEEVDPKEKAAPEAPKEAPKAPEITAEQAKIAEMKETKAKVTNVSTTPRPDAFAGQGIAGNPNPKQKYDVSTPEGRKALKQLKGQDIERMFPRN